MGVPKLARELCGARQAPGPRAGMWDGLARLGYPDWPVWQGSSLHVGSDLLKFEEPVSTQEQGTFSFRTPKVRLAGWAGQAGGPRGLALWGQPSYLRGLSVGGPGAGSPPALLRKHLRASLGLLSPWNPSHPPSLSLQLLDLEASPCCPSAVRGHTVVTLGGSGGSRASLFLPDSLSHQLPLKSTCYLPALC